MKEKLKLFEQLVASEYKDSPYVSQTVIIPFQDWAEKKENLAYPREVIYPFKEYDFCGHKLYSFNNVKTFCELCYGKKALKREENGTLIDPLPMDKRKAKHNAGYNLDNSNRK